MAYSHTIREIGLDDELELNFSTSNANSTDEIIRFLDSSVLIGPENSGSPIDTSACGKWGQVLWRPG